MPVNIFFCYAREDEEHLIKIKKHLKPLQKQGLIKMWYDRDISAGAEWEKEISERMSAAHIILLLISSDFMGSDYCYGVEMEKALERYGRGEALVIPIILRAVYWQDAPFGKLQALPKNAQPIIGSSWKYPDEAFYDMVQGLIEIIKQPTTQSLAVIPAQSKQIPKPVPETRTTPGSLTSLIQEHSLKPLSFDQFHSGHSNPPLAPKAQPSQKQTKRPWYETKVVEVVANILGIILDCFIVWDEIGVTVFFLTEEILATVTIGFWLHSWWIPLLTLLFLALIFRLGKSGLDVRFIPGLIFGISWGIVTAFTCEKLVFPFLANVLTPTISDYILVGASIIIGIVGLSVNYHLFRKHGDHYSISRFQGNYYQSKLTTIILIVPYGIFLISLDILLIYLFGFNWFTNIPLMFFFLWTILNLSTYFSDKKEKSSRKKS